MFTSLHALSWPLFKTLDSFVNWAWQQIVISSPGNLSVQKQFGFRSSSVSLLCLKNMAIPLMFPLRNRDRYLPIFIYSPQNLLISNFIKLADLFRSSPYPYFRSFQSSVWVNVHVSAAYSATLQTKHFIILFFCSRFIKQFIFLHKHFLCHLSSVPNIFCAVSILWY